jgi:hypothetical protein
MKKFAHFMAETNGRIIRVIAGIALIVIGLLLESTPGYIIAVIGIVPLAAGVFDFCLLTPLVGLPFKGKDVRQRRDQ